MGNVVASESACIVSRIKNTQLHINLLLKPLDIAGHNGTAPAPKGIAISQLRIPAPVSYRVTYEGLRGIFNATVSASHSTGDTFLGQFPLANPKDFKVIIGKNTSGWQKGLWALDELSNFSDNFTFPTLSGETQSIDNAVFTGDGIVTKSSQEGIGAADYSTSGFHVGVTDNPDCIKSVLAAIDDPPEIERVYAVPCDWTGRVSSDYYIIIKAKEYLLADLEIESMDLDGEALDLQEFEHEGHYKPYTKFGKQFLTERNSDNNIKDSSGNNITLSPGEFYVRASFPDEPGYGSISEVNRDYYTLNIKLKNPAGKTKTACISIRKPAVSFVVSPTLIDIPPYYGGDSTMPHAADISVNGREAKATVGVCEYKDYEPFIILKEGDASINCHWSGEGNTGDQKDYKIKLSILPKDMYAKPIEGDNEMSLPVFEWNIVRADPTFIQTHRSYSQFAKYDTLRRFEQYGYSIDPAYFNETDKTVLQKIDSAISGIVDIEESFSIEKAKITARARALSQNQPSGSLKDKASLDLIAQLAKDKEIRVRAIMENINNFASAAFAKEAFSKTTAPCAWTE